MDLEPSRYDRPAKEIAPASRSMRSRQTPVAEANDVLRHEGLRPLSGRVVEVSATEVLIERRDKRLVSVETSRLDKSPQRGQAVLITFGGSGDGTVRSLREQTQERAFNHELAR